MNALDNQLNRMSQIQMDEWLGQQNQAAANVNRSMYGNYGQPQIPQPSYPGNLFGGPMSPAFQPAALNVAARPVVRAVIQRKGPVIAARQRHYGWILATVWVGFGLVILFAVFGR